MDSITAAELLNLVPMLALIVSVFTYYQSVKERHYKAAIDSAEVNAQLNKVNDLLVKLENIQKYLTNDEEALETHRNAINGLARRQRKLCEVVANNSEGIYLCMQHEVKGNHVELLEKWMRESVKNNITEDEELIPKDDE